MFLLINKPKGITSHDVVDRLRRITGIRKIGHAGTLDPNATGLLILGIGRESTKKLSLLTINTKKTYVAEIYLGEERDTDDVEGKLLNSNFDFQNKYQISKSQILKTLESFLGKQMQIPPAYSAIKVKGTKAYQYARKGKNIDLKPRKVTIHSIKLIDYNFPKLKIETQVSSGTYIRALARDIGRKLGCGAYLINLERTKIDKYNLKESVKMNKLNKDNWKDFALQ